MSTNTSKSPPGTFPGRDFPIRTAPNGKPTEGAAFPAAGRGLPRLHQHKNQERHISCSKKCHVAPDITHLRFG